MFGGPCDNLMAGVEEMADTRGVPRNVWWHLMPAAQFSKF
jgi:hypothetical protein